MPYGYVIYDGWEKKYLALRENQSFDWVDGSDGAWMFPQSWQAAEARDQYGFFGCEVRLVRG
jgi:hypothetical protein